MNQPANQSNENRKMYNDLATWWPLLSAPAEYTEDADFYHQTLLETGQTPLHTMLELGSGGGNNAFHLKAYYHLTLVDLSEGMLAVSQALNPECEHQPGDMRTVRLGREFDVVFVHDAVDYMLTETDLRQAIETAYLHCRAGGVVLFAPDHLHETFAPSTDHGGHDGENRAMRYLEWTYDPDESDSTVITEYAYVLREGERVWVEHDQHIHGLFSREQWLRWLAEAGFTVRVVVDDYERELFVGEK